ncbi:hypothetical protein JOC58_002471 [Paenibacillus hunanensis]|uniref:Uncharacterized protein n=1 Tax=Paenibacillus hunanensis TaxID=539262 RepID=A0ABU1IZ92_9BACL|nr:hypothetical protein [Paenibacillus hunanensis]
MSELVMSISNTKIPITKKCMTDRRQHFFVIRILRFLVETPGPYYRGYTKDGY